MKTVYAFSADNGVLLGPVELDDGDLSPLESTEDAPVYLIPGNCLETEPPAAPEGKQVVAVDGAWTLQDLPPSPEPEPEPTLDQRAAVLLAGVDAHMNRAARSKGYDNIITASLRAALPASPFHAEGLAFGNWMDAVYAKCYEILAAVVAGAMNEPTLEQLIAMLPPLNLPDSKGA